MPRYERAPKRDSPARTLEVAVSGGNHTTVSAAVAAAITGDTILIHPGTYEGSVDASAKGLNFVGLNPLNTIISKIPTSLTDYGLKLGPNSSVENLTVNCFTATPNAYGGYDGQSVQIPSAVAGTYRFHNCRMKSGRTQIVVSGATATATIYIEGGYYEGKAEAFSMHAGKADCVFRAIAATFMTDGVLPDGLCGIIKGTKADSVVSGCSFYCNNATSDIRIVAGMYACAGLFENCDFTILANTGATDAIGALAPNNLRLKRCSFQLSGLRELIYANTYNSPCTVYTDLVGSYAVGPLVTVTPLDNAPDPVQITSTLYTEVEVLDEVITFSAGAGQTQSLAHTGLVYFGRFGTHDLNAFSEVEEGGTEYIQDTDFTVDVAAGTITRLAAGAIPATGTIYCRYYYYTSATAPRRFHGDALSVIDGMTAPDAIVGKAIIYVDVADGDLKVKFGDGTTKVLAADT